jgi:Alg9-like mannosyltransferase family
VRRRLPLRREDLGRADGRRGRHLRRRLAARLGTRHAPNDYLIATGSGPWYEYVVDFVLLSPPVAILFLMFCGRFVAARRRDLAAALVLVFICYAVACLSLVPKNPRFALPLDPLLRLCAASMVVATAADLRAGAKARAAMLIAVVMLVVVSDARGFPALLRDQRHLRSGDGEPAGRGTIPARTVPVSAALIET